jgi:menaquinone-dependent protoporphyrinogen IX oxidase
VHQGDSLDHDHAVVQQMNDNSIEMEIHKPPPEPVGCYDWGGLYLYVFKKPNWFQRLMIRWFFGWKWVDADDAKPKR